MASDQATEAVLNFNVPRNRRLLSILGVNIDIMIGTMPFQITAGIDQFSDKLVPFQTATSISFT